MMAWSKLTEQWKEKGKNLNIFKGRIDETSMIFFLGPYRVEWRKVSK